MLGSEVLLVILKHIFHDKYSSLQFIAKISVTSPIVINMPTRERLPGEIKSSFV